MKKPLPIGISDFKELIDGGYAYVDKTLLIEEIVEKVGDSFFPSIYPVLALFRENEDFILDNTYTFNHPQIVTFFKNYNNEPARASVSTWYGKPCFDTFLCKDL